MTINHSYKLTRTGLLSKLTELAETEEPATTLYLPVAMSLADAELLLKQVPSIGEALPEITKFIAGTETGAVIFWGQSHRLVIKPPFPIKEKYVTAGYETAPLEQLLNHPWKVGIVLVRLGYYSIGIARDEKLIAHKTGTGLVHGRQRQGGSSANRFRQRRVEQTHHFLERVVVHVKEMFEPEAKKLDFFVYGGAHTTITALMKHNIFFKQFENRLLPPRLDIVNPHLDVLEQSAKDVWSSRVAEWNEREP
ncbi:MAG: Vms1/Ankzf1 family peptidyl-tRNA hydrolase [Dehalococcoidales bacterium]|nr:Vms1/Ankzf1 family peptidyl-tRNA hydrolase [Dehalococcoidales bacterium]